MRCAQLAGAHRSHHGLDGAQVTSAEEEDVPLDADVGSEVADMALTCGYDPPMFEDSCDCGVSTNWTANAHGGPFTCMAADRQSGQKGW